MKADYRLAVPVALAWVVLALAIGFPPALVWLAIASWAAAVGLFAAAQWGRRYRSALLLAALTAVVAGVLLTSSAVHAGGRQPGMLIDAATDGKRVSATAVVTEMVYVAEPTRGADLVSGADLLSGAEPTRGVGSRFAATLTFVGIGEHSGPVSVPVLVFGALQHGAGIGTEVQLSGTVRATPPEDSTAFLLFPDAEPQIVSDPPWYLAWANELRNSFRAASVALPGDGGALLPGLAIGDTSAVSDELDAAMKASSLSHLTAVSGANCAVIIGLIMLGGAVAGVPRGWRVVASVTVLFGFVVLVTPEPSVLRAAVMATLVLAALASGRPLSGIPVLSLAVAVLLTIDPWLARSYGFVLSVLATAGLLLLAGPIARRLANWIPLPLAVLIAVPISAQLACQPVLIMLAPTVPLYGVLANTLVGPAAPIATVLGLLACLLLPVLPAVGALVAQLAWVPSSWIAAVATLFSALPGARLPWPAGPAGVVFAAVVTALGLLVALVSTGRWPLWRRMASAGLVILCVAYFGALGGEQLRRRLSPPADWQLAVCDIGQGDAALVRSAGKVALIDTGPDPATLEYCLDTLGIGRIDLLVLTHFDLDHVGGTRAILGRVDRLMAGPTASEADKRIVAELTDAGATTTRAARGDSGQLGDLRWRVLWPPARLQGVEPGNAASVALEFTGVGDCATGCLHSVHLGDLGEQSQERLLALNQLHPVDVVQVAHHGSKDQSSRLYERLRAKIGLIGVGADNDYGHPNAEILSTLAATNTVIGRTDLHGLLLVSLRESAVQLWTERSGVPAPD